MKSIWNIFFNIKPEQPLTGQQQAEALEELAEAVKEANRAQESPEHQRVSKLIQEKLNRLPWSAPQKVSHEL